MRLRESVRGLVIDPDGSVLLVKFDWPGLDLPDGFWANPGGGIETGETRLDAIRRELREETGLVVDSLGPEVWTKTAHFRMNGWDGQIDHIHLYRTEWFDPAPSLSAEQLRDEGLHELRWWSPEEIAQERATFAPRSLPELLTQLHRDGTPERPIEITGF